MTATTQAAAAAIEIEKLRALLAEANLNDGMILGISQMPGDRVDPSTMVGWRFSSADDGVRQVRALSRLALAVRDLCASLPLAAPPSPPITAPDRQGAEALRGAFYLDPGPEVEPALEAAARRLAAFKIASSDPTGRCLPDDIWKQAVPEAYAALATPTTRPAETVAGEAPAARGSSKWGPSFPPSTCTAFEDCAHDGWCHDIDQCRLKGPAEPDDEPGYDDTCFACGKPMRDGELVLEDVNEGTMHAACCGPEPESYVDANEPHRFSRRRFGLGQAAKACTSVRAK